MASSFFNNRLILPIFTFFQMIQIDNINPIKQFEILNCETWVSFSYPNMSKGLWDTTNNWVLCENKIKKVTVEAAGKGPQWEKNGGEKNEKPDS